MEFLLAFGRPAAGLGATSPKPVALWSSPRRAQRHAGRPAPASARGRSRAGLVGVRRAGAAGLCAACAFYVAATAGRWP